MHPHETPHEKATNAARDKLQKAETELADYLQGDKVNPDRIHELTKAVTIARRELIDLFSSLWPGNT